MERVSILVPTHNRAAMLRETLDSILAQTFVPDALEVLVSDNASTDDTRAVLRAYEARLPGLRVVHQAQDIGAGRNCQFLLAEARGELVYLLCDDDAIAPTLLEEYARVLDEHPAVDMVSAAVSLRGPAMEPIAEHWLATPPGLADGARRVRDQLISHHMVMATMYRKRVLVDAGGWRDEVGTHMDCSGYCRTALRARATYYVPRPLLRFRISPGSWGAFAPERQAQLARWYRRKLDLLRADAAQLAPSLVPFLATMDAWHAKSVMHVLEIELAHRRVSGADVRGAMRGLLAEFPEARRSRTAWKLWLSTWIGLAWLAALRRVLGKPSPYDAQVGVFGRYSSPASR